MVGLGDGKEGADGVQMVCETKDASLEDEDDEEVVSMSDGQA